MRQTSPDLDVTCHHVPLHAHLRTELEADLADLDEDESEEEAVEEAPLTHGQQRVVGREEGVQQQQRLDGFLQHLLAMTIRRKRPSG